MLTFQGFKNLFLASPLSQVAMEDLEKSTGKGISYIKNGFCVSL